MSNLTNHVNKLKRRGENQAAWAMKYAPYRVKQAVVEKNYDDAMAGITAAIKGDGAPGCKHCGRDGRPEPWALQAWLNAAGATNNLGAALERLLEALGVGSEQELAGVVASGKRMEQLAETPPAVMLYDAAEVIKLSVQQDPAVRTEARRVLRGLLEVLDGLSTAEEVNGDGH